MGLVERRLAVLLAHPYQLHELHLILLFDSKTRKEEDHRGPKLGNDKWQSIEALK